MCGISGRFNFDGSPVAEREIVAMRDAMIHRGPDGAGTFIEGPIGLGHRRLSIIDLEGGRQPLSNEDGSITVVFNGEIYNFEELRKELLARGHTFTTRSDTEVIVHLYEEDGPECVQRFRGMFAFALWDARRKRLLLARDRLGVKPLYYAQTANSLLFASEIKSLLLPDLVPAEIDTRGLRRYLSYRHSYGNGTLFKGVNQLAPGHYLVAAGGKTRVQRYWDVPERNAAESRSPEEFLPLLEHAVKLRMISDVPIGSFLSGGVDSSVITALMARQAEGVQTFSIGFVPGEESELGWAKRVADWCGARHHEFEQGSGDFFSLLQRLVWNHDEPLTFPASIPLYLLSRESKAAATVMLGGEGADEILAGYGTNVRTYWLARARAQIPHPLVNLASRLPLGRRYQAMLGRMSQDETTLITGNYRLAGHQALERACRLELPSARDDDRQLVEEVGLHTRGGSFLDRFLYFQLKTYLVALLMKQDKMSMAASIETRVPYLDHHLVELAFSLPDRWKVRGREGKHLLKRVALDLLPRDVVKRPKQGFPVPIASWFRERGNPFMEILLDAESLRDGLLDPRFVRSRVDRFLAGEQISLEIWAMLNLELWRRAFFSPSTDTTVSRSTRQ